MIKKFEPLESNAGIHYDCDPGQDDAIALLFALGAGINITSISVVGGNVDVRKCARNALQLLELTNREDIPVYIGANNPMVRKPQHLPEIFGECGMAGANLPEPKKSLNTISAIDFLANNNLPETLVLTGPLTNIALALQKNSNLPKQVKNLIIMGGCVYPEKIHGRLGNIQVTGSKGWAEYNFAVDPEAAQIVFSGGFKNIFLVPLEVTRQVLYGLAIDNKLRATKKEIAIVAANILSNVGSEDRVDYSSLMTSETDPVRAMHDVVAMCYLTDPDIFKTQEIPLKIIIEPSPAAAGQSLINENFPDHKSVTLITDLNHNAFIERLISYLKAV